MSEPYVIRKKWHVFRRLHGMQWVQRPGYKGRDGWTSSYPDGFKEFIKLHGIKHELEETEERVMTPDGRVVKKQELVFTCPNKDVATLLKLSYL